jgi:hypothetical protein
LESWEPPQHLLLDRGKPRKTCIEEAGQKPEADAVLTFILRCDSNQMLQVSYSTADFILYSSSFNPSQI